MAEKSDEKPTTNKSTDDKPASPPAPTDPKDTATTRSIKSTDMTPKIHCEEPGHG